jgi:hypothetical protein
LFDPTAYENMKIVMEGVLYDKDLAGEISITDRNELINTAKLSRRYEITFQDRNFPGASCTFIMEAALENLAAELHPAILSEKLSGCRISIQFCFEHKNEPEQIAGIDRLMKAIWGENRTISQTLSYDPLSQKGTVQNKTEITFGRLIYEDQIDDLALLSDHMGQCLRKLEEVLS